MKSMAVVLQQGKTLAALPEPTALAPADALTLASELIEARALPQALPYLRYAQEARPTAFGWCRLAKLCRELGRDREAAACYARALTLEPGNRYALVGRAAALAQTNATLEELVEALQALPPLLAEGHPAPVLRAAATVLRAVSVLYSHPAIARAAQDLRRLAVKCDVTTPAERRAELQAQLASALQFVAEPLPPAPVPTRTEVTTPAPRRALPAPDPEDEAPQF